ncbi:MAG: hypothetical protein ABDI20_09015 [Candidatus Bipolaricaulaceae bacterium]
MIEHLLAEVKLSISWGLVLVTMVVGALRLAAAFSSEVAQTWVLLVPVLKFLFPALFPFALFQLLEREKGWRTLEVLAATPKRKASVFGLRAGLSLAPAVLATMTLRPSELLAVLASGLALGGLCLVVSVLAGEEVGFGLSLAWWGSSLALSFQALGNPRLLSWFMLFDCIPLSPKELFMRRVVHLSAGLFLLGLGLALADHKRSWSAR